MQAELKPGDTVIALAGAAITSASLAGGISGAISAWLTANSALALLAGVVGGAAIGWCMGALVGRILFPASSGNTVVVKKGPAALPPTLKGNVGASLAASLAVSGLVAVIGNAEFTAVAVPSVAISVVLGVVLALLASFT